MTPKCAVASSLWKSIPTFRKVFYLSEELLGRYICGGDGTLNINFLTKEEN
jgi:hypothetical protein